MKFLDAVEVLRKVVYPHQSQNERKNVLGHLLQIGVQGDEGLQQRFKGTDHPEAYNFRGAVDHV